MIDEEQDFAAGITENWFTQWIFQSRTEHRLCALILLQCREIIKYDRKIFCEQECRLKTYMRELHGFLLFASGCSPSYPAEHFLTSVIDENILKV